MGFRDRGVEIKTPEQIAQDAGGRAAGRARPSSCCAPRCAPGITTGELDAIAEKNIRDGGGVPSFLGYGHPPFPATICASVNDEVVHGIPGDRVLEDGDVISIDCGAIVDGWHGDAAITVAVGEVAARRARADAGHRGLDVGRASPRPVSAAGSPTSRTRSRAYVRSQPHPTGGSYGILEDFTGHGIGTAMHQPPERAELRPPGPRPKLERGLALAVEPMVTLGSKYTELDEDEWTVVTDDGSWAAHFEHTFTLTPDGAWVLTALDGGRAKLAELGVPYGGD